MLKLFSYITGYTGQHCEIDINECYSNPCHYGTCRDGLASFTCQCRPGYTGRLCETNINECLSQPCKNGGICQDRENTYICSCPQGTAGETLILYNFEILPVKYARTFFTFFLPLMYILIYRFQLWSEPGWLQEQALWLREVHRQNKWLWMCMRARLHRWALGGVYRCRGVVTWALGGAGRTDGWRTHSCGTMVSCCLCGTEEKRKGTQPDTCTQHTQSTDFVSRLKRLWRWACKDSVNWYFERKREAVL